MRFVRVVVAVLMAVAALLVLAPAALAASATTVEIGGLEYAATATQGRFGGAAKSPVPGAWLATVVHEPLRRGEAVPITGGSFTLHGKRRDIGGAFVRGTVAPLDAPTTCGNERFAVTGTLALRGGGRGSFSVVLTHLRVPLRTGCQTYGAVVVGSLTVPTRAAAT